MSTFFRSITQPGTSQYLAPPFATQPYITPMPAVTSRSSRRSTLSAQQLMDIEVGLFLLSQLLPTASPDVLPHLLTDTHGALLERPTWTPRQHKLLNRGRMLLAHIRQNTTWAALLDAYVAVPERLQAYDISTDRSRFREKSVGFFRNRIFMLKQMVG
jgi:hypothetical protein